MSLNDALLDSIDLLYEGINYSRYRDFNNSIKMFKEIIDMFEKHTVVSSSKELEGEKFTNMRSRYVDMFKENSVDSLLQHRYQMLLLIRSIAIINHFILSDCDNDSAYLEVLESAWFLYCYIENLIIVSVNMTNSIGEQLSNMPAIARAFPIQCKTELDSISSANQMNFELHDSLLFICIAHLSKCSSGNEGSSSSTTEVKAIINDTDVLLLHTSERASNKSLTILHYGVFLSVFISNALEIMIQRLFESNGGKDSSMILTPRVTNDRTLIFRDFVELNEKINRVWVVEAPMKFTKLSCNAIIEWRLLWTKRSLLFLLTLSSYLSNKKLKTLFLKSGVDVSGLLEERAKLVCDIGDGVFGGCVMFGMANIMMQHGVMIGSQHIPLMPFSFVNKSFSNIEEQVDEIDIVSNLLKSAQNLLKSSERNYLHTQPDFNFCFPCNHVSVLSIVRKSNTFVSPLQVYCPFGRNFAQMYNVITGNISSSSLNDSELQKIELTQCMCANCYIFCKRTKDTSSDVDLNQTLKWELNSVIYRVSVHYLLIKAYYYQAICALSYSSSLVPLSSAIEAANDFDRLYLRSNILSNACSVVSALVSSYFVLCADLYFHLATAYYKLNRFTDGEMECERGVVCYIRSSESFERRNKNTLKDITSDSVLIGRLTQLLSLQSTLLCENGKFSEALEIVDNKLQPLFSVGPSPDVQLTSQISVLRSRITTELAECRVRKQASKPGGVHPSSCNKNAQQLNMNTLPESSKVGSVSVADKRDNDCVQKNRGHQFEDEGDSDLFIAKTVLIIAGILSAVLLYIIYYK